MHTFHKQEQPWHNFTRWNIYNEHASIQLELWPESQSFGGTAYIYGLWVNPDQRRKGLAAALLDEAEAIAEAAGHKSVHLDWNLKDTPREVLEYYCRRGYDEREFDGHGNYCLLEKNLLTPKAQKQ